jgi:hypothetical protein
MINSAAQRDVVAKIPEGRWRLSRPLVLPSNARIRGEGATTVLMPAADNTARAVLVIANASHHVRIQGVTFDGSGPDFANPKPLIVVTGGTDVVFDHIVVQNSHGIGLLFQGGVARSGVADSRFQNLGNHWKTTRSPKDRLQGLVFCCGIDNDGNFAKNNVFEDIGLDALQFSDQTDFTAVGNVFNLVNHSHALIHAPDFPSAIFPARSSRSVIASNVIYAAQGCGIDAPGLRDTVIMSNRISGSQACGIGLFPSYDKQIQTADVTLCGNIIVNNGRSQNSPFRAGVTISSGSPHSIYLYDNIIADTQQDKTQKFGVQVMKNTHLTGLKIDGSNRLSGNAEAPIRRNDDETHLNPRK